MQLREENVADTYEELDALVHDYFRTTIASEGLPPLRFNWPVYVALNEQGLLKLYTANHEGKMVGFVMYHIQPHLHHVGHITAACDMLAVRPEHRGKGIARALMEFAEPRLKKLEVNNVMHMFRTCYTSRPLFPKLGYKLIELGYLKELE